MLYPPFSRLIMYLPRDVLHARLVSTILSVCPSVCLSVCLWHPWTGQNDKISSSNTVHCRL